MCNAISNASSVIAIGNAHHAAGHREKHPGNIPKPSETGWKHSHRCQAPFERPGWLPNVCARNPAINTPDRIVERWPLR